MPPQKVIKSKGKTAREEEVTKEIQNSQTIETLLENGLNILIKRHTVTEWI